ncbi:CBS domain-containing protein [Mesorhizobium qingshengii]|uniref:CBS domain-containing protein n=1 Tax=Mesorhizobium qingshengii TaxID=1165689 RepID=A0ABT4R3C5_9HYPH|nr:CBS domain-containing protein [Mesorhizobium qingshengii]MCZ8548332.1 CBS domain-containing protein [Mesorhizobium qingshengii]
MLVDRVLAVTRKRLVTVEYDAPMLEAAQLLAGSQDLVVVCGPDGLLKGVITKTDIVRQIGHCRGSTCQTAISSVMTRDVAICRPTDWLHDVWSIMKEHRLKNIPVTDAASRPIGVLNARDALEALMLEVEQEEMLLRDYVMCVGYR